MVFIDIYGIGVIISLIVTIIFLIRNEREKAYIAIVIFLAIMLLKYILAG